MVDAAKAVEAQPELIAEIDRLKQANREDGERIAALEVKLQQRCQELDETNRKLKEVESERDDAGFRLLETENQLADIRSMAKVWFPDLVDKPQPVAEPTPPQAEDAEAERPTQDQPDGTGTGTESEASASSFPAPPQFPTEAPSTASSEPVPDQTPTSEEAVRPTAVTLVRVTPPNSWATTAEDTASSPSTSEPTTASTPSAEPEVSASTEPKGIYEGKRYADIPEYIPEDKWIDNGGTVEDYYWRPGMSA
jgi:hypothetical protein